MADALEHVYGYAIGLIMTGTPEDVNAVVRGDVMRGAIAGLGKITVSVAA